MDSAGKAARRGPYALGLVILVHLALGWIFLSMSGSDGIPAHTIGPGFVSGSGSLIGLRAPDAAPQPRQPEGFHFSFDRSALIGPSSRPAPAKPAPPTRKVAPPDHPA